MITIRPIHDNEISAAKRVIMTVGYGIFGWNGSLDESIKYFENSNEFADMDDLKSNYFNNSGLFLAVLDNERLVGTGALRKMDRSSAELKRIWLLEAYHGHGIGYKLVMQLFEFASAQGYGTVKLQTSPQQTRAIAFYKKLGFLEIPPYNDLKEAVFMGIKLDGTN